MKRTPSVMTAAVVQLLVLAAFGWAYAASRTTNNVQIGKVTTGVERYPDVPIPREVPLRIAPLYDRPEMASDAELMAVLKQVRPKFPSEHLRPNFVEHALRIWGVDATFADPDVMSGEEMQEFLVNHGKYLASWEDKKVLPLLLDQDGGISIRWGRDEGASVHHDHWLASLTEAGVRLDQPVYLPSQKQKTIADVLQQSLRDFKVDERETEWSVLAFGLWLPPATGWKTTDGREVTFDLLAHRLMRGREDLGVCHGLHRVYSLMVLIRLDDEHHLLTPAVREESLKHLRGVRTAIMESQFADGHWPSNWPVGKAAIEKPADDPLHQQVIATGHHLEWLAIAPEELHPPREQMEKAARWLIDTTKSRTEAQILEHYTFYSHVGGALALWRKTRAADFWSAHEEMAHTWNAPVASAAEAEKAAPAEAHP